MTDGLTSTWILSDVLLPVYPFIVLQEITKGQETLFTVLRCLAACGSGASSRIAAIAARVEGAL